MPFTKREIKKACELAGVDFKSLSAMLDEAKAFYAKPTANFPSTEFLDQYFAFYQRMMNDPDIKPKISPSDARSGKNIYDYLYNLVRAKNPVANESDAILAWRAILENYPKDDRFYRVQLNLSQIERNLNNIVSVIKQRHGKLTGENSIGNIAEIVRRGNNGI